MFPTSPNQLGDKGNRGTQSRRRQTSPREVSLATRDAAPARRGVQRRGKKCGGAASSSRRSSPEISRTRCSGLRVTWVALFSCFLMFIGFISHNPYAGKQTDYQRDVHRQTGERRDRQTSINSCSKEKETDRETSKSTEKERDSQRDRKRECQKAICLAFHFNFPVRG